MSYRSRHRWFRRMAFGLAFASVIFAGRASVAAAKFDEGTEGSRYVSAGGWSGLVDMESGIPLSAGIPHGDEQFLVEQEVQVIPYLSHGILTEQDAQVAAAEAIHDPYLIESQATVSGDEIAFRNAIESQGNITSDELAFANAVVASAESLHDPLTAEELSVRGDADEQFRVEHALEAQAQGGLSGYLVDVADELIASQESLASTDGATVIRYLSPDIRGEALRTKESTRFVPGVTDFPYVSQETQAPADRVERALEQGPLVIPYLSHGMTSDDVVGVRPDDRADRFAHSDVASRPELASGGDSGFEWNDALTVGIGGLVLALGLGLALGYLRRPRLAGL